MLLSLSFIREAVHRHALMRQQHFMIAVCTVFLALKNTVGFYLLSLGTAVVFGITTAPVAFNVFLNGLNRKHHHAPQKQFTATLKNASICNSAVLVMCVSWRWVFGCLGGFHLDSQIYIVMCAICYMYVYVVESQQSCYFMRIVCFKVLLMFGGWHKVAATVAHSC